MFMATARLAPEKAVFRPALPLCFLPGIAEMRMSKTYFEKLKDPRWQKKRLEALDHHNWSCEQCGDSESTLHVHHRQYFKGREPWEYEVGQLAVLCEDCHSIEHEAEDKLLLATSFVVSDGPFNRLTIASLIAGFCHRGMGAPYVDDPDAYVCGQIAQYLSDRCRFHHIQGIAEAIEGRDQHTVRAAVEDFIKDLKARPNVAVPPLTGDDFL